MGLTFKLTGNNISPALSKMAREAKNPQKVLRAMGTTFMGITMGNFRADPSYRPAPWPAKKDGSTSYLMKNNVLSRSFHLEVTAKAAKVSNPTIYGPTHQFGRTEGRGAPIPARPFFPVVGQPESPKLTEKASEKIKAAGERAMMKEAE